MKHITFLFLSLFIGISLVACGATPATPSITVEEVQSTAVAAAFTAVAQTQASIPTDTPPPPTETASPTPVPTETALSSPTVEVTFTSVPPTTAPSNVDPCATRILSASPRGRETTIKIVNTVRAQVTVSVYLNETAGAGECGYRSYTLGSRDSVLITDLVQGCYNLWAFNNDSRNPVNAFGYGCINNPDKWTFEIFSDNIKFSGP